MAPVLLLALLLPAGAIKTKMYPAVARLAEKLKHANCKNDETWDAWSKKCSFPNAGCTMQSAGQDWGTHSICTNLIEKNKCGFLSYGISNEYSFDKKLNKEYGCEGIALDPTVYYPGRLPNTTVNFLKVGAPMLTIGGQKGPDFKMQAPTIAKKQLNQTLSLLKMDCEGCEYALASNILKDDPKFLHNVNQFVLETHVDNRFMKTAEHLYQYDRLLQLIDEAGLELMDARMTGCGEDMEWRGMRPPLSGPIRKVSEVQGLVHEKCLKELTDAGYECSLNCQNFLFARPAKPAKK
jgi:hypothetical protein